MKKCIFCDNDVTPDTKPEHILLNALGGRKTTRGVVCTAHNEGFGSTIDKGLTDQVPIIRNLLHLESGTGNMPPMLRNIQSGNDTLNIKGDGTIELDSKPFALVDRPNGVKELQIRARSAEHLAELIPHIAAKLKLPEQKVIELLKTGRGTVVSKRPDVIRHDLQFGGPNALRSMMKACLELWATIAGNSELKSTPYAAARQFVLAGDADFLRDRIYIDTRPLPHVDEMAARFSEFFNLIYVRSDVAGRVIGHFTLYNIMGWQMVLAENGGRPDARIGLISNPLKPATWSDRIADEIDIQFAWLNAPERPEEHARARARFSAMMERHQKQAMDHEVGRIVESVFKKHGLSALTMDTDEQTRKRVIGEISMRTAKHFMGLPHEQQLTAAEIEAMVLGAKTQSRFS